MSEDPPAGAVALSDALASLRRDLSAAWSDGQAAGINLKPTAVELTLQVGLTRSSTGRAGVKWWLFEVGGERGREAAFTQTVKLVLEPQLVDPDFDPTDAYADLDDADLDDADFDGALDVADLDFDLDDSDLDDS